MFAGDVDLKLLSGEIDTVLLGDSVGGTNAGLVVLSLGNTVSWAAEDDEEVHTEDTDGWVILDAEIDVLSDTEAEVAVLGEAALWELVGLDTEGTLDDIDGLLATDGNLGRDVLTTADTEATDGQTRLAVGWLLVSELGKDLGNLGELIAFATDAALDDELFDTDLTHWVFLLSHGYKK